MQKVENNAQVLGSQFVQNLGLGVSQPRAREHKGIIFVLHHLIPKLLAEGFLKWLLTPYTKFNGSFVKLRKIPKGNSERVFTSH